MKYLILTFLIFSGVIPARSQNITFKIVDTNLQEFYNNTSVITEPAEGESFYGQDANYNGFQPSYTNNNNETITDNITGLMWQQEMGDKISSDDAFYKADTLTLGGHTDWRVPTIKELYSLILFSGITGQSQSNSTPYIDTDFFIQPYGNEDLGERFIDAQTWSATEYIGKIMNGNDGIFGVNFIDGRIKGYPKTKLAGGAANKMYFRMVRGNTEYGNNNFVDNKDGTISDLATGLMWQQTDNGQTYDWQSVLNYAESLDFADYSDWRLPNAKELQSIVDYTRCPDITNSPAIDSLFSCTEIQDPDGNYGHYGFYWTGTTHHDGVKPESFAVYIAFGEAQGFMNNQLLDVHGAGAQRGDPKTGNPADYPTFFGPQGDVRYVFNFVRCVRTIDSHQTGLNLIQNKTIYVYPNPCHDFCNLFITEKLNPTIINIYSFTGEKVKEVFIDEFKNGKVEIKMDDLIPGIYNVTVRNKAVNTSHKIIKI